jgi:general secretion pathway protein G
MRTGGFTLVELLFTVVIVAVLAMVALPISELTWQRSKEQELRRALQEIRDALNAYRRASDEGRLANTPNGSGFPPTLAALVVGITDAKDPAGAKIFFLRRIPKDPFQPDAGLRAERTWGLRSYESPPDDPRPGRDVFDVYSLSTKTGLNGIPYRYW